MEALFTISWLAKRDSVCLTAYIHNDNVRTNLLDVFVWNTDIRLVTEQVKELVSAGNKDLAYLPAALIKFKITDSSQFFAVAHIDHIFTFQFRKEHIQKPFLSITIFYFMQRP